ncbi:MAG: NAD(P)H-quinone oxidoreductase subunit 2, chloroplastic [Candidatus Omnitrophica bacterium]|nr:NAD(P)H-quinone oxidoreductase subunit 2, chloroplastic [Candidatus Omnitrophota bacterium]
MTSLMTELIYLTGILGTLCLAIGRGERPRRWALGLGLLTAVAAAIASACSSGSVTELFGGTYRVDPLSQGYKAVIASALAVCLWLTERGPSESRRVEVYLFYLCSALGLTLMTGSTGFVSLYVAMELSSYSLYLLAASREDRRATEGALRYLLTGAIASGVFLWGVSILCGLTGGATFAALTQAAPALTSDPLFIGALALTSFAFLFKLSAFPVHFWAPDAYQSAPLAATTLIATASKAGAVAVISRFLIASGVPVAFAGWTGLLAFVSMTLGNTAALHQADVKRLLAYSSIAQAGYILTGLLAGTADGYSSAFFYATVYALMNCGAFLVVSAVAADAKNDNPTVRHFDGLADRQPFLALVLLLSLLSLAGIPPLAGFTGKWVLFSAAMDQGHWFLVLWGVLNSVVSLFYYLTLVKHSYLEKAPAGSQPLRLTPVTRLLALAIFAGLVFLGVYPTPLIEYARSAVSAIAG